MDTDELYDYLTEQGVDKRDIEIIKASPYSGEVLLNALKTDPERVAALGLSAVCLAKLRALVVRSVDCHSAQEAKSRQKHVEGVRAGGRGKAAARGSHEVRRTGGQIVYLAARETQEAVITFGYSSSDED